MSLRLSWERERESGRPLASTDIDHYDLTGTLDGKALTLAQPAPADLSALVPEQGPGFYAFKMICFPKRGAASDPATCSIEIFDETKVVIMNFTVEVVAP